jgi:hypothetical protein
MPLLGSQLKSPSLQFRDIFHIRNDGSNRRASQRHIHRPPFVCLVRRMDHYQSLER